MTILTTTQAARLAGLSPRTICGYIDRGMLKGWRVPGSAHRRVAKEELVKFLGAHGMPLPKELGKEMR